MQSLFAFVRKIPNTSLDFISQISSYPAILFDEPHQFESLYSSELHKIAKTLETKPYDFLVFVGPKEVTYHWKALFEISFPKLFIYTTEEQEPFQILSHLNQKFKLIRNSRLRSSKTPYTPSNKAAVTELFSKYAPSHRQQALVIAKELIEEYELEGALPFISTPALERILYCLALLKEKLGRTVKPSKYLKVLDVGTHIWSYAPALRTFFESKTPKLDLTGLELDGQYLFQEGFLRRDIAKYHATLSRARYLEQNFIDFKTPQDIVLFFMPIVLPENAIIWQIEENDFEPVNMFKHCRKLILPGGQGFIFNGVQLEYERTLACLKEANIHTKETGPWHCPIRQGSHGYYTRFTV